jgi:predicted dehydrogenase
VTLYGNEGTLEVYADGATHWLRGLRNADSAWKILPIPDAIYGDCDRTASTWVQIMQIFTRQSVGTRLFIDAIANNSSIDADFHAGARAQAVMEAAFASDRNGYWAEVPHQ